MRESGMMNHLILIQLLQMNTLCECLNSVNRMRVLEKCDCSEILFQTKSLFHAKLCFYQCTVLFQTREKLGNMEEKTTIAVLVMALLFSSSGLLILKQFSFNDEQKIVGN